MDDYLADIALMDHIEACDRAYDAYLDSPAGRAEMAAQAAFEEERDYEEWREMMLADNPWLTDAELTMDDWSDYLLAGME
jgi:hypothetical protein